MKKLVQELQGGLDTLMAIEVLDYHDRNHLSGTPKSQNEGKRKLIERCAHLSQSIEKAAIDLERKAARADVRDFQTVSFPSEPGRWVNLSDRLPAINMLVYTRTAVGRLGVYTRYEMGWNSKISVDNDPIVEWYDQSAYGALSLSNQGLTADPGGYLRGLHEGEKVRVNQVTERIPSAREVMDRSGDYPSLADK